MSRIDFGDVLYRNLIRANQDKSELVEALEDLAQRLSSAHESLPWPGTNYEMNRENLAGHEKRALALSDAVLLAIQLIDLLKPRSSAELEIDFKYRRRGQPRNWQAWEKTARHGNALARRVESLVSQGWPVEAAIKRVQERRYGLGWSREEIFHWRKKRRNVMSYFGSDGQLTERQIKQLVLSDVF